MRVSAGANKIQVIKVIREATGLDLKDSLERVDAAPRLVSSALSPEQASSLMRALQEAGAFADLSSG